MTGPIPELIDRAAVLATFELAQIAASADATSLVTFLQERCQRVETSSGEIVWSLTDRERRRCFAGTARPELQRARQDVPDAELTPIQTALDKSLGGGWSLAELETLDPEAARALSVVAGWWDGHHPHVPDPAEARQLVERLNLFADLRRMATDNFVDRIEVLDGLRAQFRSVTRAAALMYGLGGIGKSALVAKHVMWAIEDPDGPHAYAAVLDFDDPSLSAAYPLDLCHRIITAIARQADGDARPGLNRLIQVSRDLAETARYRDTSSSRAVGVVGPVREMARLAADLAKYAQRPVLVVFDTVEQVQRSGPAAVNYFVALVEEWVRVPGVKVVAAGRADIPTLRAQPFELTGLDRPSAVGLLRTLGRRTLDRPTAEAIIDAVGTSPLTIRLAARLLADADTEPGDLFTMDLQAERINGELYRRVLRHIRDAAVRKLAHPGLVLRRITPHIIEHVLAEPCGVRIEEGGQTARDLYRRLSSEAMLVDHSHVEDSLVHRPDVRRVMLPQLLADQPEVAARIQRRAVRYYVARTEPIAKVEELYHRLMLNQRSATLDKHWDARAAEALITARDEFPDEARIYLTRRLPGIYLDDDDRRRLGEADWRDEVEPQVARLLGTGNPAAAISLLRERRTPDGRPLIPALEIEALEASGDLLAAIDIAREFRRRDAVKNDESGVTVYTLHLSRLLERTGDQSAAEAALAEALSAVRTPNLPRLRLIVAMLGLRRRRGIVVPRELRTEVADLHQKLGDRAIKQVPGLLRDLAAEVGAEEPEVLENALRTIGIDAMPEGAIPPALYVLDHLLSTQRGTSGVIGEIAGLTGPYEDIASKPRGETGRALLEVIQTVGTSSGDLRLAVRADYQQESDAALLGIELNYRAKA